jgi:hypothetical protein
MLRPLGTWPERRGPRESRATILPNRSTDVVAAECCCVGAGERGDEPAATARPAHAPATKAHSDMTKSGVDRQMAFREPCARELLRGSRGPDRPRPAGVAVSRPLHFRTAFLGCAAHHNGTLGMTPS